MTNQTKIRIIKAVCWAGVLADALWTVALIFPGAFGLLTGRPEFQADLDFRLVMGIGASLMAGWTFLLVWAARNPIERRGVMLLTFCPVIIGLFIVTIIGMVEGNGSSAWILVKLIVLSMAIVSGYVLAGTIAKKSQ